MSHKSVHCTEMSKLIQHMAEKYPSVKFCQGVATEVITGEFPASNLPYVVIYSGGTCVEQLSRATASSVIKSVKKHMVKDDDESDSSCDNDEEDGKFRINRVERNYREDVDVEDDREFSSNFLNRHILRR